MDHFQNNKKRTATKSWLLLRGWLLWIFAYLATTVNATVTLVDSMQCSWEFLCCYMWSHYGFSLYYGIGERIILCYKLRQNCMYHVAEFIKYAFTIGWNRFDGEVLVLGIYVFMKFFIHIFESNYSHNFFTFPTQL